MVKQFSFKRVQKAGAIFNVEKLDWLNGVYIRNLSDEALLEKCLPYLPEEAAKKYSSEQLMAIIKLEKERIKKLSEHYQLNRIFLYDAGLREGVADLEDTNVAGRSCSFNGR